MPVRVPAFVKIAALLGEHVAGLSEEDASRRAIAAGEKLRADIGIPNRLRDLKVQEGQLRGFAEKALSIKRVCSVNPRAVTVEDLEGILKDAY